MDQLRVARRERCQLRRLGLTALATVVAPLTRQALLAAFVFCFVQSVGTLSTVIFWCRSIPAGVRNHPQPADQGSWAGPRRHAALIIVTMLALALLFLITGRRFAVRGVHPAGA